MNWPSNLLDDLARATPGGYAPRGAPATEPTAWAALALAGAQRQADARRAADWIAGLQARDGSVGVSREEADPKWPTALATLVWCAVDPTTYRAHIERATQWALAAEGRVVERKPDIGHDTTLVGWSWADHTHSWLEPTALFTAALRAAGQAHHARVGEGVRLIVDRLLPSGGANYGNTIVLGQELLPHVQPTGLALWALAGAGVDDPRLERSLAWLERTLGPASTPASLGFGLLGLRAHGRWPLGADDWLASAHAKLAAGRGPALMPLAALAAALYAPVPAGPTPPQGTEA